MRPPLGELPRRSMRLLMKRGPRALYLQSKYKLIRRNDPLVKVLVVDNIDNHAASNLAIALEGNTNLKSFRMNVGSISVATARIISRAISRCQLEKLEISLSSADSDRKCQKVMSILYQGGLAKSQFISRLVVHRQIGNVTAMLDSAKALRSISLHMPAITDDISEVEMEGMCMALREKTPLLTCIEFKSVTFGGEKIKMLSSGIMWHKTIQRLSIGGCYLEDCEAEELVRDWETANCNLVTLEADHNSLSAVGVLALLQANCRCRSLSRLKVNGCYQVDDLGLMDIAKELRENTKLTWNTIDVSECIPGAAFVIARVPPGTLSEAFSKVLQVNTSIFELKIHGNGIAHEEDEGQLQHRMDELGRRNVCRRYSLYPSWQTNSYGNNTDKVLWCHILEKYQHQPCHAYWHLAQQPALFAA